MNNTETSNVVYKMEVYDLSVTYGSTLGLKNVTIKFPLNKVTGLIGPSGCGKTSLLRCLNRMNDLIPNAKVSGRVLLDGNSIYDPSIDVADLRRHIGMIFQKSNPFPKTVFENVAYGLRLQGIKNKKLIAEKVEDSLKKAAVWDQVKDRLHHSPFELSGGQQQRLCIARALAVEPHVLLMDEPASALDPGATAKIEDLILHLKENYTIIIVTHNMLQAARISDNTAFFMKGELIEYDQTQRIFSLPNNPLTKDYISGKFG
jgi:phosphate transport system ATP-binding protein